MAYEKLTAAGYIKSRRGIGYEVIFTAPLRNIQPAMLSVTGSPPPTPGLPGVACDVYSEQGREIYCRIGIPDLTRFPGRAGASGIMCRHCKRTINDPVSFTKWIIFTP